MTSYAERNGYKEKGSFQQLGEAIFRGAIRTVCESVDRGEMKPDPTIAAPFIIIARAFGVSQETIDHYLQNGVGPVIMPNTINLLK